MPMRFLCYCSPNRARFYPINWHFKQSSRECSLQNRVRGPELPCLLRYEPWIVPNITSHQKPCFILAKASKALETSPLPSYSLSCSHFNRSSCSKLFPSCSAIRFDRDPKPDSSDFAQRTTQCVNFSLHLSARCSTRRILLLRSSCHVVLWITDVRPATDETRRVRGYTLMKSWSNPREKGVEWCRERAGSVDDEGLAFRYCSCFGFRQICESSASK